MKNMKLARDSFAGCDEVLEVQSETFSVQLELD
jgi:hypothetical protein